MKYLAEYTMARTELGDASDLYRGIPCTRHMLRYNDRLIETKRAKKELLDLIGDDEQEMFDHLVYLRDSIQEIINSYARRG
jgi:hypothetical protein